MQPDKNQTESAIGGNYRPREFVPVRALRNPHLMTIRREFWRRRFPGLPAAVPRTFEVEPGRACVRSATGRGNRASTLRSSCCMDSKARPNPVHPGHGGEGLRGRLQRHSAEPAELRRHRGIDADAISLGPELRHSRCVAQLLGKDRLPELFAAGFSMGGNLVLKMAGEFGDSAPPGIRGKIPSPLLPHWTRRPAPTHSHHLSNSIYEHHFVTRGL